MSGQGSANAGPSSSCGQGSMDARSDMTTGSCALKVVVPHIEADRIARRSLHAPQFARGESDRVNVLAFVALALRGGIREQVDAVIAHDDAVLAARIQGQPRVACRMNVLGSDPLADLEEWAHGGIDRRWDIADAEAG